MRRKLIHFLFICVIIIVSTLVWCLHKTENISEELPEETETVTVTVAVDTLYFERTSRTEILLSWSDKNDLLVDTYIVKKRLATEGIGMGEWQIIDTIQSDGSANGKDWHVVDELSEAMPQQFEYRVDVELAITEAREQSFEENEGNNKGQQDEDLASIIFEPADGTPILASNVKICIDPGHFDKPDMVAEADKYAYVEGNFVLEVALELQQVLKWEYGIDSCLTRDSGTITLGGYTNEELDSAHISLRGAYAAEEDCDLFVSLHTNSNAEDANGYETFSQPLAINKPIIIVNTVALESETAIKAANAIGTKLASVNYELGLSNTSDFQEETVATIGEWTKEYNDGLNELGTVVIRTGKKNPDYYGVLRGATDVSVPGMIIEHGFHSVQEVRKAATIGDLKEVYARADACGIAYGFGFTR